MIALFTDFGLDGPYVGQLHAVLAKDAPGTPVIDLFHSVPTHDIRAGAYLLAAYIACLSPGSIIVGVVDPGVGGARRPAMLAADGRWFVGPDNGLFHIVARRARRSAWHEIEWRPARLSESFHGRDLFAPVAGMLARGAKPAARPFEPASPEPAWPDDLGAVVYVDRFGNAVTGIRAGQVDRGQRFQINGSALAYARTFSDVPVGRPFWYENANGLIEIAANQADASQVLGLAVGDPIALPAS